MKNLFVLKNIRKLFIIGSLIVGVFLFCSSTLSAKEVANLQDLSDNFDHTLGDILQIILYGVTALAIILTFMGFNHLRLHHNEPQAKHVSKAFVNLFVALGLLSGAPLLHMLQNTLLEGVDQGVVKKWDMKDFNRDISAETGTPGPGPDPDPV